MTFEHNKYHEFTFCCNRKSASFMIIEILLRSMLQTAMRMCAHMSRRRLLFDKWFFNVRHHELHWRKNLIKKRYSSLIWSEFYETTNIQDNNFDKTMAIYFQQMKKEGTSHIHSNLHVQNFMLGILNRFLIGSNKTLVFQKIIKIHSQNKEKAFNVLTGLILPYALQHRMQLFNSCKHVQLGTFGWSPKTTRCLKDFSGRWCAIIRY